MRIVPSRNDPTDDLVTWHGVGPMRGEVAFGEVQIGAAHAARRHSDQHFARPWHGIRSFPRSQPPCVDRSRAFDPPREHDADHRTGATMQS